jgi:hypothetical protein
MRFVAPVFAILKLGLSALKPIYRSEPLGARNYAPYQIASEAVK